MLRSLGPEELASLYDESREKMPPDEREVAQSKIGEAGAILL